MNISEYRSHVLFCLPKSKKLSKPKILYNVWCKFILWQNLTRIHKTIYNLNLSGLIQHFMFAVEILRHLVIVCCPESAGDCYETWDLCILLFQLFQILTQLFQIFLRWHPKRLIAKFSSYCQIALLTYGTMCFSQNIGIYIILTCSLQHWTLSYDGLNFIYSLYFIDYKYNL